jgi:hexokinase
MYMGELVRLVIITLVNAGFLFNGKLSEKLNLRYEFFTKYVSEIEAQADGVHSVTKEILTEMGVSNASDEDCAIVRYICELVSRRSARLVASALASLILRIGDPDVTIGVDGSVYRFHPTFHDLMTEAVKELIPASYKFKFVLSEDGSGRGAALVAAVAARELDESKK